MKSEVAEGEEDTAHRRWRQGTGVDVPTFDDQIGKAGHAAQASKLAPERASDHVGVEPTDGLALDDCPISDLVVADRQPLVADDDAERFQMAAYPPRLPDIDDDLHHLGSIQRKVCRVSDGTVTKDKQLALSRSESPPE